MGAELKTIFKLDLLYFCCIQERFCAIYYIEIKNVGSESQVVDQNKPPNRQFSRSRDSTFKVS